MTTEESKALFRRLVEEVVNGGDLDRADEFVCAGFFDHNPPPGQTPDVGGFKGAFASIRAAFPDFRATVEDLVGEGDRLAYRLTFRGTHRGELGGIPQTGKAASWSAIGVVRVADGKIAERWQQIDTRGLMRQLGADTGPPARTAGVSEARR